MTQGYATLFHRNPKNPILTAKDWPYPAHTVFNPGATRLKDGTTLLLCRVEDRRGHSHLCAARSKDGLGGWVVDKVPPRVPRPKLPEPQPVPQETKSLTDPLTTPLPVIGPQLDPAAYFSDEPVSPVSPSPALPQRAVKSLRK